MSTLDSQTSIQTLKDAVLKFRDDRDWGQFHTPKNVAMAISIEAGELAEHFLWKTDDEIQATLQDPAKREAIADEVVDVFNYVLCMANVLQMDIASTAYRKIEKNGLKYPVDKAKGSSKKYTEL